MSPTQPGRHRYFACLWDGKDLPGYSGGVYDTQYVINLARNIARHDPKGRLTMICDGPCGGALAERLAHDDGNSPGVRVNIEGFAEFGCGGWSPMLDIFNPIRWPTGDDRCLMIGLDTVFLNDPSWLFEWSGGPVGLPLDPYHPKLACDAVVSYDRYGAEMIWGRYQHELKTRMKSCLYRGKPSEMALLRKLFAENRWDPIEPKPERLLSYKAHVLKGKPFTKATAIYFHGHPKPHSLKSNDPVRQGVGARLASSAACSMEPQFRGTHGASTTRSTSTSSIAGSCGIRRASDLCA